MSRGRCSIGVSLRCSSKRVRVRGRRRRLGNHDFSAVFGDGLTSTYATGGDYLYDILSPVGDLPGSAAATSGGFLAELLSLL
jgi:hypothetical protein